MEFKCSIVADDHEIGRVGAAVPKDQLDGLKLEFPDVPLCLTVGQVKAIGGFCLIHHAGPVDSSCPDSHAALPSTAGRI